MKLKSILIFLTTILLLAAANPNEPVTGKLKTFYSSQNRDTVKCFYDAEGRFSCYIGAWGYKTSYEYNGNIIIETTSGGSRVTMYLNSRVLMDSLIDIDTMRAFENESPKQDVRPIRVLPYTGNHFLYYLNGGIASRNAARISKKFVYDSLGFLRQETEYVNGKLWASSNSVVEGGNITSYVIKYFFSDTVTAFNPTTNKTDIKVIQLSDRFFKINYDPDHGNSLAMDGPYGKCSKNLTVRMIDRTAPGSKDSTVVSFKYTFDEKGRVATLIKTEKSTDPPEWNNDANMGDTCSFTYY